MKVLFLDIDGVLNTALWHRQADKNLEKDQYGYLFDSKSIANLANIIDETGAHIVISSSWKCMGLPKLQKMWVERGLPGKIIDATPDCQDSKLWQEMDFQYNRGCEIKAWLTQNGKNVSHYAILDDLDDILPEQEPHFVWIDPETGITEGNVAQAVMILNHLKYEKEDSCNS